MHELSIADAVVRIAARHAAGRRVTRVEVKVGHLRQVVPDSLAFAFELVAGGTVLEGAELVLEEVPAAGRCRTCGAACAGLDVEVIRGEELQVDSLELEEAVDAVKGEMAYGG
jgi:hydrogenase nickel incorporation protein HypA/HybF